MLIKKPVKLRKNKKYKDGLVYLKLKAYYLKIAV